MASMVDREHEIFRDYTEKALRNVEMFRNEAQMFLRRFTPERRQLVKQLKSAKFSSYDVLTMWQEELAPVFEKLKETRGSSVFNKSVKKHLYIEENSEEAVDLIVSSRENKLRLEFVDRFEPLTQRQAIANLIDRPLIEVYAIRDQYIHVTLAQLVAKEQGIKVIDPHSSIWKRIRTSGQIRRERKRTIRRETGRLAEIDTRLEEIEKMDDNMIGQVMNMDIDLISTLAAKASYEKRLKKLSKEDVVDAATRLEIFNDETREIRTVIMNNISGSAEMSLESVYRATKSTDKLLLKIFDLTNTQKNNLLLSTKEHRELRGERDKIAQSQKERIDALY